MTRPDRYRILLAGPSLLYAPVYLAWLTASEFIQKRVKLWTPRKQINGDDQLMDEFHDFVTRAGGQGNVLFCVGDILRYHAYKPKNGKRRTWTRKKYLSSLITSAPVTAYRINLNHANNCNHEILLCHRNSMTTYEIAEVIQKKQTQTKVVSSKIFDKISLGYEDEYIHKILQYVGSDERNFRTIKKLFLILPDTHAASSIHGPLEVDKTRNNLINKMHGDDGRLLFTGILDGKSDSPALRDDFVDLMDRAVGKIRDSTDWAADTISNNVANFDKFGNLDRNKILSVLERVKNRYEIGSDTKDEFLSGITAAAKMRYNWSNCHSKLETGVQAGCNYCKKISDVQKPFRGHE